ncbi:MAG: type I secretion system permease/ATPase, partial [Sphingomonas sp.]
MAGRRLLTRPSRDPAASPIATTFRPLGGVFGRIVLFSAIINLATLTTSLFTMQIYDRVLSSQSVDTLLYLTFATLVAVALAAILEGVRQQVANGVASWAARRLGPLLLARSLEQQLTMPTVRLEALRELSTLKTFLATPTVFSLIDMLWVPLYLAIIYLLHPAFAGIALVGALTLFGLAWLNERVTREQIRATQRMASSNMHYAESLVR